LLIKGGGGGGGGKGGAVSTSATLALPAVIVITVLILGAVIYLWRARYIRRKTAYVLMTILVLTLIGLGVWMYEYPMATVY
jgi:hypothetical protein